MRKEEHSTINIQVTVRKSGGVEDDRFAVVWRAVWMRLLLALALPLPVEDGRERGRAAPLSA